MGNKARVRRAVAQTRQRAFDMERYEAPEFDANAEPKTDDVKFFSIRDGEDVVEYWGPRSVARPISMQALDIYATQGEAAANVFMLRTVLGADGYEALLSLKTADDVVFDKVIAAVGHVVLGKEAPRGSSTIEGSYSVDD